MPSSVSHSSSGINPHGSTQYLIDPSTSHPGVIYHEGPSGKGHVAYPISQPQDDPPQDPIIPEVEDPDPCPHDGPPEDDHSDPVIPQEEIQDPCPIPDEPVVPEESTPLECESSRHSSRAASIKSKSEGVIPDPPPVSPPSPPAESSPHIPEATPMHSVEDECGCPPDGTSQIDPPSLQLDAGPSSSDGQPPPPPPPPPLPDQTVIIVAEVETSVVKEEHHKKKKKEKKSKHKGKTEECSVEPEEIVVDNCTPTVLPETPTEPTTNPANVDVIVPEVEPYIMAEGDQPLYSKPDKRSKKGGKSKKKKKKKKGADRHDDAAIGEDEIEAVISGLDQSIRQAERAHTRSITELSTASDDIFDDPRYPAGFPSPGGFRQQHVRIPSEVSAMSRPGPFGFSSGGFPGTIPDVDDVFVVINASNNTPVDYIPSTEYRQPPRDFIIPGEGTDDLPDDLDIFGGGTSVF